MKALMYGFLWYRATSSFCRSWFIVTLRKLLDSGLLKTCMWKGSINENRVYVRGTQGGGIGCFNDHGPSY